MLLLWHQKRTSILLLDSSPDQMYRTQSYLHQNPFQKKAGHISFPNIGIWLIRSLAKLDLSNECYDQCRWMLDRQSIHILYDAHQTTAQRNREEKAMLLQLKSQEPKKHETWEIFQTVRACGQSTLMMLRHTEAILHMKAKVILTNIN